MTGRKKRKLSLLTDAGSTRRKDTNRKKENLVLQTWSELPVELLEVIASRLSIDENIRASSVCKRWHSAAISVRVVKRAPMLMFFPKFGDLFEFYDPSKRKFHSVGFPQLNGCRVCYTKGSWLLLHKPRTLRVFFFNPFTEEVVKLPRFELASQIVAFSAPPTSTSCIVFTIKHVNPTVVAISTCYPGALEWTTVQYQNVYHLSVAFGTSLFSATTSFTVKVSQVGWAYSTQMNENGASCQFRLLNARRYFFPSIGGKKNMVWCELKNLGGATIFSSYWTTYADINLPGIKRNSIYFSKICYYGRQCISYSLEDGRYHPRNECHDWGEQDPFKTIWIDPPESFKRFN